MCVRAYEGGLFVHTWLYCKLVRIFRAREFGNILGPWDHWDLRCKQRYLREIYTGTILGPKIYTGTRSGVCVAISSAGRLGAIPARETGLQHFPSKMLDTPGYVRSSCGQIGTDHLRRPQQCSPRRDRMVCGTDADSPSMLISAHKLCSYLSTTVFPVPIRSAGPGGKSIGYIESAERLMALAASGDVVGCGTRKRLRSVQMCQLTDSARRHLGYDALRNADPDRGSSERGDRNSVYREHLTVGVVPMLKRATSTGALVRWPAN